MFCHYWSHHSSKASIGRLEPVKPNKKIISFPLSYLSEKSYCFFIAICYKLDTYEKINDIYANDYSLSLLEKSINGNIVTKYHLHLHLHYVPNILL